MADSLQQQPELKQPLKKPPSATVAGRGLAFWAYLTILVSFLTLLLSSTLPAPDQRSWFLSLPADLRRHYSAGRLIKLGRSYPGRHLFVADNGPGDGAAPTETVLLLHGLGSSSFSFRRVLPILASSGLRALALDLPGSGFSDPLSDRPPAGPLARIWAIYREIRVKGVFWGFDHLVETGYIPYEEPSAPEGGVGGESIARAIADVVDSMALAPVHLVLHDSAIHAGANWAAMSPASVRSVTLLDSAPESAAFPSGLLGVPLLGQLLLSSRYVFTGLLKLCCSRGIEDSAAEAYRFLLKRGDGRWGVVEAGNAMNFSFDLGEWAESEAVKDMPVQVLWSNNWSDLWIDEGRRGAAAVPRAKLGSHSGGRWPQEDAADEIANMIAQFVLSLPKSIRQNSEEPVPEHIQRMFDEANGQHEHLHNHHHEDAPNYINTYGMGQGWGS